MSEMAAFNTILSSLNATVTILKGLVQLDRDYAEAELKAKLVDVLEQTSEARTAILSLQEQVRDLQAKLDTRASMHYRHPAYWQRREGQPDDGPFCAQCWGSAEKRIRLQPAEDDFLVCKACGNVFGDSPQPRARRAQSSLSDFYSAGT